MQNNAVRVWQTVPSQTEPRQLLANPIETETRLNNAKNPIKLILIALIPHPIQPSIQQFCLQHHRSEGH